jgi:hypothetical protein
MIRDYNIIKIKVNKFHISKGGIICLQVGHISLTCIQLFKH